MKEEWEAKEKKGKRKGKGEKKGNGSKRQDKKRHKNKKRNRKGNRKGKRKRKKKEEKESAGQEVKWYKRKMQENENSRKTFTLKKPQVFYEKNNITNTDS